MTMLLLGLLIFLGVHSARVVAEPLREMLIEQWGDKAWKGLYSVLSLLGFVLLVMGYEEARQDPVALWSPPMATRHIAGLLMLLSFVLMAAAYVPGNAIKARLRHPMTLSVKVWAFAHLIANGNLADVLLFGGFLVWSVLVFRAARARDRLNAMAQQGSVEAAPSNALALLITLGAGTAAWAAFAFWAHARWIGVSPFGVGI